jgi:hypothetical protein
MSLPTTLPGNMPAAPAEIIPGDGLNGAQEIRDFWNGVTGRNDSLSNVYNKLSRGIIPAHRIGNLYFGSKTGIRRRVAVGTGLAA